jgi:Recombination endonuclease VII
VNGIRPDDSGLGKVGKRAALTAVQDGRCAICGAEVPLHADHDHDTGLLRGMLCQSCNNREGRLAVGRDPDPDLRLSGTEERFLAIAASFAAGRPADLSAVVTNSLGWAHARRAAEAILIATDTTALLAVGDTAKLGELKAPHDTLSTGQ